jgi:predicted SnoaL-like aldol condensation-catalyzing enzyme
MSSAGAVATLERNKQLTLRWFEEVWSQGRREVIFELFAPECVLYEGHTAIRGPEEFAAFYDRLQAGFCDFEITPGLALAEGDLVSLRWSVRCKHKESGKTATASGISITRIRDGRFVEAWQNWDAAGLAAQIFGPPPALF